MSKMKKLALSLLLAMPIVVSATGMGVYVPLSVSNTMSVTDSPDFGVEADLDFDYKASAGIGIAFDTNIGKDSLFNYRLGLEYMKQEIDSVNGNSCIDDYLVDWCKIVNKRALLIETFIGSLLVKPFMVKMISVFPH